MAQKLSTKAAAKKKARDIAYAKGMAWQGKSTAKFKRKEGREPKDRAKQHIGYTSC